MDIMYNNSTVYTFRCNSERNRKEGNGVTEGVWRWLLKAVALKYCFLEHTKTDDFHIPMFSVW